MNTISHNLDAPSNNRESFYQQGCWTNRLNRSDRADLRGIIKKFLLKTDEKVRGHLQPFEQDTVNDEQVTAGISMFYFEEES